MKRLLTFAVLGPPLGMLTGMFGILPVLNWAVGGPQTQYDYHQIVLLPAAYMVGFVPALLAGVFDGVLAKRHVRHRVFWCALAGFAVSFLPIAGALSMGYIHGPFLLLFGLLGAVPGAVCSWLASRWA
jgi:hypothetical protein